MELVKKDDVLSIEYVISNTQGVILDSSRDQIMHFLFGHGQMPIQIEKHLEGLKLDDMIDFQILASEELYGAYDSRLVFEVSPESFEEGTEIKVGMSFQKGEEMVRVTDISEDKITLDANYPLAGQDLNWSVVVVGLRSANELELEMGKPITEDTNACATKKKATSCGSQGACGHEH
ncbi:hypothetical protein PQO03_13445 [Lentisphaera profundi]|uniref:peptidylprolyl isomerase n=1 Tax=Lentisphaera profundi TaxID=1658616 RepID=A0ABY7VYG8_9BACT|nr:hypothetical protein [Lentisphaera profundi]WDE98839.1 hypothetical protein PQO03_13445 [Lentisphaera profundi]